MEMIFFSAGKGNKTLFFVNSWITVLRLLRGYTGIETDVSVSRVRSGGSF
jgi:hypothetical protein